MLKDDLVGTNGSKKRGSGPTGKMKQLFEAASRLPRSQQQKLAAIIEPSSLITPAGKAVGLTTWRAFHLGEYH